MKTSIATCLFFCLVSVSSCGTKATGTSPEFPYGVEWELVEIPGARMDFRELFPDRVPVLNFDADSRYASGNSGCNGYSAPFEVSVNRISFGQPNPSTMMYCGPGENQFREILQRVDGWELSPGGTLTLLLGDNPELRFKRAE